jgi:hypothetical protein
MSSSREFLLDGKLDNPRKAATLRDRRQTCRNAWRAIALLIPIEYGAIEKEFPAEI